jgi:xylulokinase
MLFFPYLQGERCPLFEPQARAAFVGIDGTMTKGHFARAVLEGVAFSLRQVLELMDGACGKAREIIICGGGAKSALWRQIIADTFNLPVKTTYGSAEGSAYGAAVTAGIGCGIWESAEDAAKDNPICEITAPDPANREVYAKAYREYCNLYRNVTIKK